jgi:hypothetical protein
MPLFGPSNKPKAPVRPKGSKPLAVFIAPVGPDAPAMSCTERQDAQRTRRDPGLGMGTNPIQGPSPTGC